MGNEIIQNQSEKSIIIGVTGSIASYRTCELVRNLSKQGYPVRVLMSQNAERFIGRVTFEALSGNPVFSSEWDAGMAHIDIKNMAALFAVVPATANIIGKMANGIADDLISSTYLACACPIIVAPAMNPHMYSNAAVQRNLTTLAGDGVEILDPTHGEVVCGDEGQGKLAELAVIEKALRDRYQAATNPESFV